MSSCEKTVVDSLIIGGGIGGTYLAARYKKKFPKKSLLLVDKLSDYGGLMTSYTLPGSDITIDLGPIRFYKSIHLRIGYLANKYNLPLTEYLPSVKGQVAYLRGSRFPMETVFPTSDSVYFINEDEKNKNPFNTIVDNINKYLGNTSDLYLLEKRIELFKNNFYSDEIFKSIVQLDMTDENWQRMEDVLGYADLFSTKMNFLVAALENISLTSKDSTQYRITSGYASLPRTIAKENGMTKIKFDNLTSHNIHKTKHMALFKTAVTNIVRNEELNLWEVTLGYVDNVISPEDIIFVPSKYKTIYAKHIFSTIPLLYLPRIHEFKSDLINLMENSFVNFDIIRVFLRYDEDWMTANGIEYGKSVTTLGGGQIIHYDKNIMLLYGFRKDASKLAGFVPNDQQIHKEMINPDTSSQTKIFADECNKIVMETFGVNGTDKPFKVNGIAWASWIHPVRTFSGRNQQTLANESMYDSMLKLMFPYGKNGHFYVIENNSSFNAAWSEGSVELVDFFMNYKYGDPLFGEVLL